MKNKLDLKSAPEQLFLNPVQDSGMQLLAAPEFFWRPQPRGRIEGFSVSAHESINTKIVDYIRQTKRHRTFSKALEFNSVPVLLSDARFVKSQVLAKEKIVLTGASGRRALNAYRWDNKTSDFDPEPHLGAYFKECQRLNKTATFPVLKKPIPEGTDFAVVCRNTFNYFHFITETLCQLTLLDQLDFQGHVYFHYPNSDDKQRDFARAFVETLFPELFGRVTFERVPKTYDQVLTVFDMIGSYFQMPASASASASVDVGVDVDVDAYAPSDRLWQGKDSGSSPQAILAMNSFNSSLKALRLRALALIEGQDFSHLPKRFFVGRDDRFSRNRLMEGEDLLFEHLDLFNFDYVVFENLTPLEQIALMANAEMMISYHGAGFTNMLFANPNAYVVEIGTLQTANSRWADFWPLAHISGCHYVSFFGDFRAEDPLLEPNFTKDGILPVHLSESAVAQIVSFVVTVFGQFAELPNPEFLYAVAHQVFTVGAVSQVNELLELNADLVTGDSKLSLLKADCHKHFDEPKSELVHIDAAFRADPERWQTLVRMIWCANRCELPHALKWALARLKSDFPDRHDAFVGNHDWVRYVA